MRNTILFLALIVALANQSLFAQVPSYVPTNGLVGYWPFNGNANDESGNGNNGVVNGATLISNRFGNANSAYYFDGVSNFISVEDHPSIQLTTSLTLSAWMREDTLKLEQPLLGKGRSFNQTGYALFHRALGQGVSSGMSLVNNTIYNEVFVDQSMLSIGEWHNLVGTYNGNTGKLYLDGVLINSLDNTMNLIYNEETKIYFGHEVQYGHIRFFEGSLDDIGIWNRALSDQEITNLYNSVSSSECLTMTINTGILSTNPFTYTSSVSIYPNPANDQITIDCGTLANVSGWSIKITNMQGQEVFSQPMNTQQYVVPLNTWSGQGMYFVKIINAQNEVVNIKKIILH